MVDCFDRIAVQITELALEPVRELRDRSLLASVSLRTSSAGARYSITIAKRFPNGANAQPTFVWQIDEITEMGDLVSAGRQARSTPGTTWADPEAAYWAAVTVLCALPRNRSTSG